MHRFCTYIDYICDYAIIDFGVRSNTCGGTSSFDSGFYYCGGKEDHGKYAA